MSKGGRQDMSKVLQFAQQCFQASLRLAAVLLLLLQDRYFYDKETVDRLIQYVIEGDDIV